MGPKLKVLVLGGYGTFGSRVVRLLAEEPGVHLIVAGRSYGKARGFASSLGGAADRSAVAFDRDGDLGAALKGLAALKPDILVDASGPWQAYGEDPYRVARACIAAKIDYLDLADGRAFVMGVSALDAEAKKAKVAVLSGVSTCPVLTAAAARALAEGVDEVEAISAGIGPSPHARVGLNVIRAIASYAGKRMTRLQDGKAVARRGLTETRRFTIAPPGAAPLDHRLFSLVDTPDLDALPALFPGLKSVWFGAGPTPEVIHEVLVMVARLRAVGLAPPLTPFAGLFHAVKNLCRWGDARGGMFVELKGRRAGRPVTRAWSLIADGDHGPFIPSMAVAALVKRRLGGRRPKPGARPCVSELELEDYAPLFHARGIRAGITEDSEAARALPPYRRLLGSTWDQLAAPIKALHDLKGEAVWAGRGKVDRGKGPVAWLLCELLGLPRTAKSTPVRVELKLDRGREVWRRSFGARTFESRHGFGTGRNAGLVVETLGPVSLGLACVLEGPRLRVRVRRWTVFGVPMPRFLAPSGEVYESGEGGRFHFHVDMKTPLGRLVRYRGWLEADDKGQSAQAA